MTNDRLNAPLSSTLSTSSLLVETRFIPRQYEPNYAYPLLVLFHARGGDEDQLVRAMPALSWRNYVGLGLRGPEPVIKRDQLAGFDWGRDFELHDRTGLRSRPRPFDAPSLIPSRTTLTVSRTASSRRSGKPAACYTSIRNGSSSSAVEKEQRSPTASVSAIPSASLAWSP